MQLPPPLGPRPALGAAVGSQPPSSPENPGLGRRRQTSGTPVLRGPGLPLQPGNTWKPKPSLLLVFVLCGTEILFLLTSAFMLNFMFLRMTIPDTG